MKKLLNTLYVQTQGVYLRQEGETVVAEKDGSVLMRLPVHTLSGLVTFGNVMCSPFLLHLCAERGIAVSFLSEHGRFLARVTGPVSGNVHLRVAQMHAHDDPGRKGAIARSCVAGKIANNRNLILRRMRDHGETPALREAADRLADVLVRLKDSPPDAARGRGLEGEAAAAYFAAFNDLLLANRDSFAIANRNRRPPTDPLNALLSFLYTLLAHDCRGACEAVGLDPQIGFLHELRSGRPGLALDLMEEFRGPVADRLALALVNRQQLSPKDFKTAESGAVQLSDDARKAVLLAWQQRKLETVAHPFLGESVPVGLLPHLQALLLARHLRGDLDAYPPWMPK